MYPIFKKSEKSCQKAVLKSKKCPKNGAKNDVFLDAFYSLKRPKTRFYVKIEFKNTKIIVLKSKNGILTLFLAPFLAIQKSKKRL